MHSVNSEKDLIFFSVPTGAIAGNGGRLGRVATPGVSEVCQPCRTAFFCFLSMTGLFMANVNLIRARS
jgi:hypothetical protein